MLARGELLPPLVPWEWRPFSELLTGVSGAHEGAHNDVVTTRLEPFLFFRSCALNCCRVSSGSAVVNSLWLPSWRHFGGLCGKRRDRKSVV